MPEVVRRPRRPVDKIDAVRSAKPGALNGVGPEVLWASEVRIVDVTDPGNPLKVVTEGPGEAVTYFVRPDGLSNGSEIFTLVTPPEVEQ